MALTKNPNVLKWVDEMVALTKPDKVVWIDGSKEQLDALTDEVCSLPEGNRDKMTDSLDSVNTFGKTTAAAKNR